MDASTSLLQDAINKQDNQKYKNLPSANDENIKQSVYKSKELYGYNHLDIKYICSILLR